MYFHEDWLMKQIENMVKAIAIFIFNKNSFKYEIADESNQKQEDILYCELQQFVVARKLCEGEDFLYKTLDCSNPRELEVAVDFYQTLNLLSDEELEKCNFSREEISDGIKFLAETFGISDCLLIVGNQ